MRRCNNATMQHYRIQKPQTAPLHSSKNTDGHGKRAINKFSHATRPEIWSEAENSVTLHREKDKARRILTRSAEKIFPLGREKKRSIQKGGAFFDILNNIQE